MMEKSYHNVPTLLRSIDREPRTDFLTGSDFPIVLGTATPCLRVVLEYAILNFRVVRQQICLLSGFAENHTSSTTRPCSFEKIQTHPIELYVRLYREFFASWKHFIYIPTTRFLRT